MNKELYIKKEELLKEINKLCFLIGSLEKFLNEYEKEFKIDKSIIALKSIRNYLEIKQKELKNIEDNYNLIYRELISSCKHDLVIKKDYEYFCPICNWSLGTNIPKESIIAIDITKDRQLIHKIEKTFKDVVYSNNNLIDVMSAVLEEIQYESDIKIYRR